MQYIAVCICKSTLYADQERSVITVIDEDKHTAIQSLLVKLNLMACNAHWRSRKYRLLVGELSESVQTKPEYILIPEEK